MLTLLDLRRRRRSFLEENDLISRFCQQQQLRVTAAGS